MDTVEIMRAFVAVAEEGSFTRAAARLGRSTKLVSNHVAALESKLDTQLFNRTTRSVALTDVGSAYLERCRPILDQITELNDLVQERQTTLTGPIRMTAPTGFGSTWLIEALAPFQSAHPGVWIDLHLSDNRVALVEEGFDLAVRIGVLRDSSLRVRKLSDMPSLTCASPSYLEAHGTPQRPADLADHRCLTFREEGDRPVWTFPGSDGPESIAVRGPVRANAPRALAGLALAGIGIARCPAYAVAKDLTEGRLVEILPEWRMPDPGVYALYPPNRHLTTRLRALIDHLADDLGRRLRDAIPR